MTRIIWPRVCWVYLILALVLFNITCALVGCETANAAVNMEAIKQIESGGNPRAYNRGSGARGLYQITPICLAHWNQVHRKGEKVDRLWEPGFNREVADWYFGWLKEAYGFDDVEAIVGYNAGPRRALNYRALKADLPQETQDYLTKYQALTAA